VRPPCRLPRATGSPPSRSPVREACEAAWQATRRSPPAQRITGARPRSEKTGPNVWGWLLEKTGPNVWGWLLPMGFKRLGRCGDWSKRWDSELVIARASCKRVRAGRAQSRQGRWHTGSSGAYWGDADAGRPGFPSHAPCVGRRQAEQEEAAAWSRPMAVVGDGSGTHEAQSGGGPGKDFLADTGWCNGRGIGRKFQRLEELPDDLPVRDGGDEAQCPLLTPGAARHI
jgi:hypothetical protein